MPTIWTEANDIELGVTMHKLAAVFGRKIDPHLFAIYREELDQFDGDQSVNALNQCLSKCEFFPSIAAVVKIADAESLQAKQHRVEHRAARRAEMESEGVRLSAFMDRRAERAAIAEAAAVRMLGDGR